MSETVVQKISGISSKSIGGDRTLYEVDAGGTKYSTFKKQIRDAAQPFEGRVALIKFTAKSVPKTMDDGSERTFTNYYLDGVEEAPEGSEPEPEHNLGDGSYVKGRENPSTQRSIHASVALEQAVSTLAHTIKPDMTPKAVAEKVEPLASAYHMWLLRASRLIDDDDIPF